MAIWMDMTNSLISASSGMVGIVRAELEIAKNIKSAYPELCISVLDGNQIREIPSGDLSWLWDSENVGDAWLGYKGLLAGNKVDPNKVSQARAQHPSLRNAYQYSPSRRVRLERAAKLFIDILPPVIKQIAWLVAMLLYLPIRALSALMLFFRKHRRADNSSQGQTVSANMNQKLSHPYQSGDLVFSCGWMDTQKEHFFSIIKAEKENFTLVYLIYDLILLREGTAHLYNQQGVKQFKEYFEWVSTNCDYVLYGGKTAQNDSVNWQIQHGLRTPPGVPIKFGSDIVSCTALDDGYKILKTYGITEPFILAVGTVDHKKNYSTIYKAYTILMEEAYSDESIYPLVIVGGDSQCEELVDSIQRNPKIKNKIKLISPSDEVLSLLYQRCAFFLLSSLYEGWSLTLPEALGFGKFCIVSDVAPLREVGGDLIDYVEPENPFAWADKLNYYFKNREEVSRRASLIKTQWKKISWNDCGLQILQTLLSFYEPTLQTTKPALYIDLTTTWNLLHDANSKITGILRAELMLARYLNHYFPNIKYFAYDGIKGYVSIDKFTLQKILGSEDIGQAFLETKKFINGSESAYDLANGKVPVKTQKEMFWLLCSILPQGIQNAMISMGKKHLERVKKNNADAVKRLPKVTGNFSLPFREGDIVFSAGVGLQKDVNAFINQKQELKFKSCQLIYDFTPILIPHTHKKETVDYYKDFIYYVYTVSDLVIYGGETAMKDGEVVVEQNSLPHVKGVPIRFGSDFYKVESAKTIENEKAALLDLGITGSFIIAVGTIEMRKNHETLYKAYIDVLNAMGTKAPQLVFVGSSGWKTSDLMEYIQNDKRVEGKLLFHTPSDEDLDLLYKHCEFTLLASFYEGWSLTLPESLNYGKFCLTSDVAPLREIGEGLVEFIHPLDKNKWAERIVYYAENPSEVAKWEQKIKADWHNTTWDECAKYLAEQLTINLEL